MVEVVTFRGLEQLIQMKRKGEQPPKDWKKLVRMYLDFKEKEVQRTQDDYSKACNQWNVARKWAKELCIDG